MARELLTNCRLCPRNCGVNRLREEKGYCATGSQARIASYGAHFGEESPLVGDGGSGTLFFASCNLRCCFCQNYDISHDPENGQLVDARDLAAIMLEMQKSGCHNINFVTPSHVVPHILEAIEIALGRGLRVPLVYNSSGYDSVQELALLDGVIDIYMPDFKFWNEETSKRYLEAEDYPKKARRAIKIMHKQVGDLLLDTNGLALRGLLVRHLLMPDCLEETEQIFAFIAQDISTTTYINIMDQYRPCGCSSEYPEICRSLTKKEYDKAVLMAKKAGLERIDQRDFQVILKRLGIL